MGNDKSRTVFFNFDAKLVVHICILGLNSGLCSDDLLSTDYDSRYFSWQFIN